MVVVEELLFSEVEHKIELFPFSIHWAFLSCESREGRKREERGRGERKPEGSREGGWSFSTFTHVSGFFSSKQVGTDFVMTQSEASVPPTTHTSNTKVSLSLSLSLSLSPFFSISFPLLSPELTCGTLMSPLVTAEGLDTVSI